MGLLPLQDNQIHHYASDWILYFPRIPSPIKVDQHRLVFSPRFSVMFAAQKAL